MKNFKCFMGLFVLLTGFSAIAQVHVPIPLPPSSYCGPGDLWRLKPQAQAICDNKSVEMEHKYGAVCTERWVNANSCFYDCTGERNFGLKVRLSPNCLYYTVSHWKTIIYWRR